MGKDEVCRDAIYCVCTRRDERSVKSWGVKGLVVASLIQITNYKKIFLIVLVKKRIGLKRSVTG